MDPRLCEALAKWHSQVDRLAGAETLYLSLEANEKSLWGSLFLGSNGKNVSEREALVYSSSQWKDFAKGVAAAKGGMNHEKRLLELYQAEYNSTYLASKTEGETILRMPRALV